MAIFYISFADDEAGFLGAVFVEGRDGGDALRVAHRRGINPGGEAMIVPLVLENLTDKHADAIRRMQNRLLDRDELVCTFGPNRMDKLTDEEKAAIPAVPATQNLPRN